jgi:hypothetical protein
VHTLNPFQTKCVTYLNTKALNGHASDSHLAAYLKVRPVAVRNSMWALMRRDVVGSFPSDGSQWAVRIWYVKAAYKHIV